MECVRCKKAGELTTGTCVAGCTFAMHEKCFKQYFKSHTASAHMKEKRMDYPCPTSGCYSKLTTRVVLNMKRNGFETSSYEKGECSAVLCFSCSSPISSKNEVRLECAAGHTYSGHSGCIPGDKLSCPSPGCALYVRPKRYTMREMPPAYDDTRKERVKMYDKKGGCEFMHDIGDGETIQCRRVLNGSRSESCRRCILHLSDVETEKAIPPVTSISKKTKKWKKLTLDDLDLLD